jgi:hypothetical protein
MMAVSQASKFISALFVKKVPNKGWILIYLCMLLVSS